MATPSVEEQRPIRVLLAKPGLDGHDRGARVVAMGLRDAGFEVIYTGPRQSAEQIAMAAVDEDVDVVGLSILSGAHLSLTSKVIEALRRRGCDDIPVVVGGLVPEDDEVVLEGMGVRRVFHQGTPMAEIVAFLASCVDAGG